MIDPQKRLTVTVTEAAKVLGLSRSAAYRAVERKEIPTIRFGQRRVLVPIKALEKLLQIDNQD